MKLTHVNVSDCHELLCILYTTDLVLFIAGVKECRSPGLGKDYKGTVQKTVSGRNCQRWDKQTPHKHSNNKASRFPDSSLKNTNNYCRNPDNEPNGPWCYTMDKKKRWEYCSIPICDSGELSFQFKCFESILDMLLLWPAYFIDKMDSQNNEYVSLSIASPCCLAIKTGS